MKKHILCFGFMVVITCSGFAADGHRSNPCHWMSWVRLACITGLFCSARTAALDDNREELEVEYTRVPLHQGRWQCTTTKDTKAYVSIAQPLFENDADDYSQTMFPVGFYTRACSECACGLLVRAQVDGLLATGKAISSGRVLAQKQCDCTDKKERAGIILPSKFGSWDEHGNFGYPKPLAEGIFEIVARFAGMPIELLQAVQNKTQVVQIISENKVSVNVLGNDDEK